jgi:PAS domain S-box-containing protein
MSAPELLASAVRELALARDLATLTSIVRREARRVTSADGVTFVLRDGGFCHYVDEDAIAPLWKGRRFPMDECISGWVLRHGETVVIPDIYRDDRVPHDAYRCTFVKSLAMVPVRPEAPVATIGAYWAREHLAGDDELGALRVLADASSTALAAIDSMQRLARRSAELETVLDVLPVGVAIADDPECRRVTGNRRLAEMLGLPPGDDVSPGVLRRERPTGGAGIRHGRDLAAAELPMRVAARIGEEGRDVEVDVVRADGDALRLLCFARPLVDDAGRARGAVGAFLDVTQRNRAQQALSAATEQLHIVTETMSAPVTRCSRDLRYVWVSKPYAQWLGVPAHEIAGRPIADVIGPAAFAQLRPYFERVLEGVRVEYEQQVDFLGLGPRWVHVVYTPTFDGEGRTDGWVAVVNDIEERKHSEARLLEEARRKDEFLALLGHELRNPLAPILSAVELLRLKGGGQPEVEWARGVIERQSRQLVRLVDDLLDLSRLSTGRIELRRVPVDLRDVIGHAVETTLPLARAKEQELAVLPCAEPLVVEADPVRLGQVLSNVLNNATRYTPSRGHVTVAAGPDGSAAVVRVRDDCQGVAPEMLPRIFDMFTRAEGRARRSDGGLGIGLTLARRLVEMHGGTIEASSDGPGSGTELVVRLPLAKRAAAQAPAAEPPRAVSSEPRKVLVVEDNRDAAESLVRLVGAMGHEVVLARDGEQALDLAARHRPHVVLLDIGLPNLDGYETARRLRAQPGGAARTLVALTGWGLPADKLRAVAAGFDHHVTKPADPRVLGTLIADARRASASG